MNLRISPTLSATGPQPAPIIGLAAICRMASSGADLHLLRQSLVRRATSVGADPGALLDLSIIELIAGQRNNRLALQAQALASQRLYRLAPAVESARPLRLLAFMVPGDFMANTPVEFLLEGSSVSLDILYVAPGQPLPAVIPEHDVAFIAIAESEQNRPLLEAMGGTAASWPRPVINMPHLIARLTRDGAYKLLRDVEGLVMPANFHVRRDQLCEIANEGQALDIIMPRCAFPIIVRPVDSHGGESLERLAGPGELRNYLAAHEQAAFYVSPFLDYRSSDGYYRKHRVAFIAGQAYGCHLAISRHWMIHYLNADMLDNPANRAEESRFLIEFDQEFKSRHEAALTAIAERSGLDYMLIDCAETPDGRLLLFEIGAGMIAHSLDPEEIFPYKKAAMAKVFAAFVNLLRAKAAGAPQMQMLPAAS